MKKRINFREARETLRMHDHVRLGAPKKQGKMQVVDFMANLNTFSSYSPAYVLTNEDLDEVIKITDVKNARVLTSTGAGDSAIKYSLAGPKTVDTFDISFCAKSIMDIKTAAIPVLNCTEYAELITSLYKAHNISKNQLFSKVRHDLPKKTRRFLRKTDKYTLFGAGIDPSHYKKYFPDDEEYSKMQDSITKPFNFIWSDVCNLHNHLDKTYDVINLSNIFQYIKDDETVIKTLENLGNHLNPGGTIIVHTTWFIRNFEMERYQKVQSAINKWGQLSLVKSHRQESVTLKKRVEK